MNGKIELYLISGFMGAGKTTFLKTLLKNLEGRKVGVLVNEFGTIGIDGKTVQRNGLSLVEINNGSIFCSCLKATFIKTLIAFDKEDIDVLLIENSGFADPIGMHRLMQDIKKLLTRGYDYRGSVCLVDGTTFLDYVDVLLSVENQVLSSNFILLNKADLTSDSQRTAVAEKIRELNPDAVIYSTVQAEVPFDVLNIELRDNGAEGETANRPETRAKAYTVLTRMGVYKAEDIRAFLTSMIPLALRIKGFMKSTEGLLQVDAVGTHSQLRPVDKKETGIGASDMVLVLIGYDGKPFKDAMKALWKEHFNENPIIMR